MNAHSPGCVWPVDAGYHSVVGDVRDHNEDSCLIDLSTGLFAVADGLGGHRAGEIASRMAVDVVAEDLATARGRGDPIGASHLRDAMLLANRQILEKASATQSLNGMGTTLTMLVLVETGFILGHAGDSRAWRLRAGHLEQLSDDHTVVAQQVRDGILRPEDAERHPMGHVLTRCLGVKAALEVDLSSDEILAGDTFVLATDGMFPALGPAEITAVLGRHAGEGGAEAAARELVGAACDRDGSDNITAVVLRCPENRDR